MSTKVAINGFGRIGRAVLRKILKDLPGLEPVAVNDLTDNETLAHLFKYDSCYGIYPKKVKGTEDSLVINGKIIKSLAEPKPEELPWAEMGVEIVLECTGAFRKLEDAKKHLTAGAKKVIISAPSKSEEIPTYLPGVNEEKFDSKKDDIVDMGSCTTNCVAPVIKVLNDEFGIKKGLFTTIHSYTTSQNLLDGPHKDLGRARAASLNIVPTTTGAANTVEKAMPEIRGKLDGVAIRVPSPVVSITDIICDLKKETSVEEVNNLFKEKAGSKKLKGILGVEEKILVSTDYRDNPLSSIVDLNFTRVKKNMVKVLSWYDNEAGYGTRLAEFADFVAKKI